MMYHLSYQLLELLLIQMLIQGPHVNTGNALALTFLYTSHIAHCISQHKPIVYPSTS